MKEIEIKIKILNDILNKKIELLNQIYNITENQEIFLKTLDGDDREYMFREAVREKQNIIDEVIKADDVFLRIFQSFKGALNNEKELYKEQIKELQEKIRIASDVDFKIRAKEERSRHGIQVKKGMPKPLIKGLKASKSYILKQYEKNKKYGL